MQQIDTLKEFIKIIQYPVIKGQKAVIEFYHDLEKNLFNTDEAYQKHYFGMTAGARTQFWRLKKELFEQLANQFIQNPKKEATPLQIAYYEIYRDFFIANELAHQGKHKLFGPLAERTLHKAMQYEKTDIAASLCRLLLFNFSSLEINKEKFEKIEILFEQVGNMRNAEEKIELIFHKVAFAFSTNRKPTGEEQTLLETSLNEAYLIFSNNPTKKIGSYYYIIQTLFYEAKDDTYSTLHYCKEAIQFLENQNRSVPIGTLLMFLVKIINIQIRLKQYQIAKSEIEKTNYLIPKATTNWYFVKLYAVTIAFHEGAYLEARTIIKEVMDNRKEMSAIMLENWEILNGYLQIFLPDTSFKIGKLINKTPNFSTDKRGHNINLLILQFIHHLQKGKRDILIDKSESMRQYVSKHLQKSDTLRAACFLKMLCQVTTEYFNKAKIEKRVTANLQQLRSLPIMDVDVEIVPYERLWEMVLGELD